MLHHRFIVPLLILIALATFWRAAGCEFIDLLDDSIYVSGNAHVLQGLTANNIAWAFTTDTAGNYHPLTWLSLMLDSDLHGPGPRGYHVTNVLLHALGVVLLYLALEALTASPWRSALAALLFAVHPLRVESVAWISERKDVLSGCLAFATLLAYAAYARRPHWGRYLLVAILFTLGLLAKSMLVTLPCLLFLLDLWPLGRLAGLRLPAPSPQAPHCPARSAGALVVEKIPLLLLCAISSIITYHFQVRGGAVTSTDELPFSVRLPNMAVAYVRYLEKMVWFKDLSLYYFQPWPLWTVAASSILLAGITIAVSIRFRPNPWLAIGWLWFLGMLVPVIGLVQVGHQPMADRYSYLPTVGLLIMLVWSLPEWLFQARRGLLATGGAALMMAAILSAFTWRQIGYWRDTFTFYGHVLDSSPNDVGAQMDFAMALDAANKPREELPYLRKAVAIAPRFALAQFTLGSLQMRLGQENDALFHMSRAVQIDPDFVAAHNCIGLIYMDRHQLDLAFSAFQQALAIDPRSTLAHVKLGEILSDRHRDDEALVHYQQALLLDPGNVDSLFLVAKSLANLGRYEKALFYLQEIRRRQPTSPTILAAAGQTLILLHRYDEAIAEMQKAVQLDPGKPGYRVLLAQAQADRRKAAIEQESSGK